MKKGDTIINNASINAYIGRPDLLGACNFDQSRLIILTDLNLIRLHFNKGCHHLVHSWSSQPVRRSWYPCERCRSWTRLDPSHPCNYEREGPVRIHQSYRPSFAAFGDRHLFCVFGELGQRFHLRTDHPRQRRCRCQRISVSIHIPLAQRSNAPNRSGHERGKTAFAMT